MLQLSSFSPASAFGDPHVLTFDGLLYTFNGYGEYWLARVEDTSHVDAPPEFALQARFQQPPREYCEYCPT